MHHPTDRIAHTTAFVTPVVEHWLVSVDLICFVLYLTKIFLSKMCILHCLVPLNSVLFKPCLFRNVYMFKYKLAASTEWVPVRPVMFVTALFETG